MTKQTYDNPHFYLTAPAECPYIAGLKERKVFTHLVGPKASALNDLLTQGGFRRSQNIAYRPACEKCSACISVRVCVDEFIWTKSLKRQWKAHKSLIGEELPPIPSARQYELFQSYLNERHDDGGMQNMSLHDYSMMVEDTHVETAVIEYRYIGSEDLSAVALTDRLTDGLSMVYSFYDPHIKPSSIGTYLILDHIQRAASLNLPYLYLGYWVKNSPKMTYKERFQPQEHLGPQGWHKVSQVVPKPQKEKTTSNKRAIPNSAMELLATQHKKL